MKKLYSLFSLSVISLLLLSCNDSEFSSAGCTTEECQVREFSFVWDAGEFGRCSLACGGGEATRTVACVDANEVIVPDSECTGDRPTERQSCNIQPCVSDFEWNIGPFGACSKACGGGTRNRVVTCQSRDGVFVEDSRCSGPKPSTTEPCNQDICPEVYSWIPGEWSECSKSCGTGSRTRSVTCRNAEGLIVDDSFCTGQKPEELSPCNTQACTFNYSWVTGSYGLCSETCGGGVQDRSLGCLRDDGVYVPHSLCPSPQPQTQRACNTQACAPTCTNYNIAESVPASQNLLDILLVIDDSGSMAADNQKLANKLGTFISEIEASNMDWQACITTTDVGYFQGRPLQWQGTSGHILRRGTSGLQNIFRDTIAWIGHGWSTDEQAIKAINLSIKDNSSSNCYRQNAGMAVILISDEDERSVGGRQSVNETQYRPLGTLNLPNSVATTVQQEFGSGKRFVVNSIIVKDQDCKDQQTAEGDPAFFGTQYQLLSSLTGALPERGVASICDNDYSQSLRLFANRITHTMGSIQLQCRPDESPTVFIDGADATSRISIINNELIFDPVVSGPASISGSYCCRQ